ncbi:heat shock protein HtpX [Anoxybacillus thermarum]|uniref:Heat shock protein HtpX n=1 Tax=Anoxybacillus thermarum TaxID=404937 RepID=A0A0D0RVR5_9BACL|nr:M48 family metallopeptidase [Anoxybacillus thermarum]KIQ95722.1 heat shock protein HtpX [Anoxybacillus thermarum]
MRKIAFWTLFLYAIYALFFAFYLFQWTDSSIPAQYKGTSADPATFLTKKELMLAEQFSEVKNFLFFLSIPYEWVIYIFVLLFGLSARFQQWAEAATKRQFMQTAIYVFWLSLLVQVVTFPLSYISYYVAKMYHISTQTFSSWMRDELIDFWVNYAIMVVIVYVLYMLMKKFEKRWWVYAWLCSIPFTLFLTFIQPIFIDPLYNDFYPLKNKQLEAKILALAEKANIPAEHVFEVNMSEKTNALNAYVTGIGSNSRIVLWDTTLERLSEDEILFIMAHEMAHYVMKHMYWGIGLYIAVTWIGLLLTNRWMKRTVERFGTLFRIKKWNDLSSLPVFLLLISLLSFAASPAMNAISRYEEHAADKYAIELTKNKEAAISTFQQLTRSSLSQVHPPYLVKLFRYGHPTILERIIFLEQQ